MRVLHVAETVIGGIASHLQEIVPAQLDRFGAGSVAIIMPDDQARELAGLRALLRPFSASRLRLISAARVARATAIEVRIFKPEIIHVHSTFAGAAIRSMPRRLLGGARIVYCAHGWSFAMDVGALRRRAYSWVERILSRRSDVVINVSAHERDLALSYRLPADRLKVVTNGLSSITRPAVDGLRSGPIRLAFVGRPVREKGLDVLLRAMSELADAPIFLDVIGAQIDELTADLGGSLQGVHDRIAFHGWLPRERAQEQIAACDALVMPSRWEGLPLTALEAMRAGKAVIASDCCSFGEIVEDGVTGRLFETGNASALAFALHDLSKDELKVMGEAGRARFLERFTVDVQERRIAEIYQELVRP